MKAYAQSTPGVACASFGYDPDTYEPTYRLTLGAPGRSLALEMAERLGPARRKPCATRGRGGTTRKPRRKPLLARLEKEQAALARERERIEAERREVEAARVRAEEAERDIAARKRRELEAFARDLQRRGEDAGTQGVARRSRAAVERLEKAQKLGLRGSAACAAKPSRRSAKRRSEVLRTPSWRLPRRARSPASADRGRDAGEGQQPRPRRRGAWPCTEARPRSLCRGKRLRVPRARARAPSQGAAGAGRRSSLPERHAKVESLRAEINLVGLTVDEALPRVDKLLDDAALGGPPRDPGDPRLRRREAPEGGRGLPEGAPARGELPRRGRERGRGRGHVVELRD